MILIIEDLSVDLGEFKLEDVSLNVKREDYVTIIGPTGSGKSILLETVAGFYKPQKGRILIDGRDVTTLPPEKRCVSIVYQDYALFPHMSVFENIAYGLKKRTKDRREIEIAVRRIAESLRIEHILHRKPSTLSGGEQQRVAIARALVIEPKILLMDEPFSALDVRTREEIRDLVKSTVKEYETTVLHVTHDFDDVFSLANEVVVMKNGRIVQIGSPDDVFGRPFNDFVADFVGTNVLDGIVVGKENGFTLVKVGDVILRSIDDAEIGEEVRISIRPENIVVSTEIGENVIPCSVVDVRRRFNSIWLTLECGEMKLKAVTNFDPKREKVLVALRGVRIVR